MNRQLLIHLTAVLLGTSLLAQDAPPPPPAPGAPGAPGTEPRKDDNRRGGPPRDPNDPLRPPGRPEGRPPLGPGGFEPDGPPGGGPRDGQRRPLGDPRGGRPEGERPPGFGNGGPGEFGRPPFPGGDRPGQSERPMKATPYIGVVTSPVSSALGAQLGLNEGFGLVVDDVLPDSPAQAAGVQKYDVLKLVNDQQLVDPGQLAGLLRGLGKDADVSITLIRKAQEQKVTAKIGEKMLPARQPGAFLQRRLGGYGLSMPQREPGDDPRGRGQGAGPDSGRRFLERPPGNRNGPGPESPPPPQPSQPPREAAPSGPADLFREARPGGAPQLRLPQADGVSTFQTNRARIAMKDNDGEIEIVLRDGQRVLTAKNPGGEVVFTGPIDTPEQHAAVPALFRAKLEAIESQQRQNPALFFSSRDTAPFPPPPAPLPDEPEVQ